MCSRHLPLLSLCQCCHRYKGKQRKGMSVIQKPIPYVLFKQISRWGQKHSNAKQSRKNLMTLIPIWSANVTAAGSHTPAMSPTGALMGSILHGANSDPNPPPWKTYHTVCCKTLKTLTVTSAAWTFKYWSSSVHFQLSFLARSFEICTDFRAAPVWFFVFCFFDLPHQQDREDDVTARYENDSWLQCQMWWGNVFLIP